jgi:antitoxin CptB
MRELDAVLESFVQTSFAELGADDIARFERILELPDPVLFAYVTGRSAPADDDSARLIERIRSSHRPPS